jgi:predicted dehydrogenase
MTALVKRFDQSMNEVKRMIAGGELGSVFQVICEWGWPQYFASGWRDTLVTGGGLFQDHGSHTVDLCRWWLGEIETVSGEIAVLLMGHEVEDQALALYRHIGGAVSIQLQTRMTHKPLVERYQIDGTLGTLVLEYPGWSGPGREPYTVTLYSKGNVDQAIIENRTLQKEGIPDEYFNKHDAYLAELRHFCRVIRGDEDLRVSGLDGRKAIEAVTAAYISSWKKVKITLPLTHMGPLEEAFRTARRDIASAR